MDWLEKLPRTLQLLIIGEQMQILKRVLDPSTGTDPIALVKKLEQELNIIQSKYDNIVDETAKLN